MLRVSSGAAVTLTISLNVTVIGMAAPALYGPLPAGEETPVTAGIALPAAVVALALVLCAELLPAYTSVTR